MLIAVSVTDAAWYLRRVLQLVVGIFSNDVQPHRRRMPKVARNW